MMDTINIYICHELQEKLTTFADSCRGSMITPDMINYIKWSAEEIIQQYIYGEKSFITVEVV